MKATWPPHLNKKSPLYNEKSTEINMKKFSKFCILPFLIFGIGCESKKSESTGKDGNIDFPATMVQFSPYPNNPIFQGTGQETWDKLIRERGYILFEDGLYKMWYTGYNEDISNVKYLGYATSDDGISWERYSDQPIINEKWTEDIHIIKYKGLYYMMAEGEGDITHLLTSTDGINWHEEGDISILKVNGQPIGEGPYGTPTVWIEGNKKHLFYERNDEGIWLATSNDFKTWTNVQDDPVLEMGPKKYDAGAVATNQIVKYNGRYYMYYHGSSNPDWMDPNVVALWTSNVAMSKDLVHWVKYPGNPIVEGDHSSPILVNDENGYKLYTMHDKVWLYSSE